MCVCAYDAIYKVTPLNYQIDSFALLWNVKPNRWNNFLFLVCCCFNSGVYIYIIYIDLCRASFVIFISCWCVHSSLSHTNIHIIFYNIQCRNSFYVLSARSFTFLLVFVWSINKMVGSIEIIWNFPMFFFISFFFFLFLFFQNVILHYLLIYFYRIFI